MSTLMEELTAIKAVEDKITSNKVANFAYTDTAYQDPATYADGVETYDVDAEQNIPVANASIMKVNPTILTKGWRAQASSITRMLMNHFLGRISYNLNKVNDLMSLLLTKLMAYLGQPNGIATLDVNGHLAQQSPVGSPYVPMTMELLGVILSKFLGRYWSTTMESIEGSIYQLYYEDKIWVCSTNSGIYWSSNGVTWQLGTGLGDITSLTNILGYAEGHWICFAHKTGNILCTLWSDNGKNWSEGTVDNQGYIDGLTYGNGVWNTQHQYSTDGKNFVWRTQGGKYNDGYLEKLWYLNGVWTATYTLHNRVDQAYTDAVTSFFYSTDGVTWSAGSQDVSNFDPVDIMYANNIWVAVSGGSYSTEGISTRSYTCKATLWSTNGYTWSAGTGFTQGQSLSLAYACGMWVTVGLDQSQSSKTMGAWYSSNGKAWTAGTGILTTTITTSNKGTIVYGNGRWVASPIGGGLYWSVNGKSWYVVNGIGEVSSIVYAMGVFLIRAYGGTYYSTDGQNWGLAKGITSLGDAKFANGIWLTTSKRISSAKELKASDEFTALNLENIPLTD